MTKMGLLGYDLECEFKAPSGEDDQSDWLVKSTDATSVKPKCVMHREECESDVYPLRCIWRCRLSEFDIERNSQALVHETPCRKEFGPRFLDDGMLLHCKYEIVVRNHDSWRISASAAAIHRLFFLAYLSATHSYRLRRRDRQECLLWRAQHQFREYDFREQGR
jgi:hypothetical protein